MTEEGSNKIIIATYITLTFLIIESFVVDFQLIDALYIISVAIYFIRYMINRKMENCTK